MRGEAVDAVVKWGIVRSQVKYVVFKYVTRIPLHRLTSAKRSLSREELDEKYGFSRTICLV
jgi:hypothetical protein